MKKFTHKGSNNFFIVLCMLFLLLVNNGCAQEKTYWKATTFTKANGEAMHGFTPDRIGELLKDYRYVTLNGALLHLDFPTKRDIKTDTMQSFSNYRLIKGEDPIQYEGKLLDKIDGINIVDDVLQIKFQYLGTLDNDKNFILKFKKLTKANYEKDIAEEFAYLKSERLAFNSFIKQYVIPSDWKIKLTIPITHQHISGFIGDINVSFPNGFQISKEGAFYKNTFDKIKVGSFTKNNLIYKITVPDAKNGLDDGELILVKAQESDFNITAYLASNPQFRIVEQKPDSFHALRLTYDEAEKRVQIVSYISFKHIFYKGIHVFLLSNDQNDPSTTDGSSMAKLHYLLMKNTSVSE